jgi:hypothetical protein
MLTTLRPGDAFRWRGGWREITYIQGHSPGSPFVYVCLDEPGGEPVEMVGLDGRPILHQPRRTLLFHGALMFPALVADEHVMPEPDPTWW